MQLRTLTFAPLSFRVHPNKMTSEAEDEILKIYFQQLLGAGVVLRDRSNWFCRVADSEAYRVFYIFARKAKKTKVEEALSEHHTFYHLTIQFSW